MKKRNALLRPFKQLSRQPFFKKLLVRLVYWYTLLVYHTCRWEMAPEARAALDHPSPKILTFWHGRMLMMPHVKMPGEDVRVMISEHGDGELITQVMRCFSIGAIRGSTSKKGDMAALQALRALKQGVTIAITPDGPRGPRMRLSPGIVTLAALSGAPVVPLSFATRSMKLLKSWDRFALPLPFSRGVYLAGPPVQIPREAAREGLAHWVETLEATMIEHTRQADRLAGRIPVEPAERPAEPPANPAERAA